MASEELCRLPYAERVQRCDELLQTDLSAPARAEILYFKAHGLYELDQVRGSLAAADDGVAVPACGLVLAMLQAGRALCLYDLFRLDEMAAALAAATVVDVPVSPKRNSLEAMTLTLRGLLLGAWRSDGAFDLLVEASNHYQSLNHTYGRSWALQAAAKVALRIGHIDDAQRCLTLVEHPKFLPTAQLVESEILLQSGRPVEAMAVVDRVLSGDSEHLRHGHRARARVLQAMNAFRAGEMIRASVLLTQARDEASMDPRRDVDLSMAISELRSMMAGRGVA